MPFRKKEGPQPQVRVYSYEAVVVENGAAATHQMWAANRYRNDLVAVELRRRDNVKAALATHCPQVAALEAEYRALDGRVDAAEAEAKAARAKSRKRTKMSAEASAAFKALKAERKAAYAAFKAARDHEYANNEPLKAALKACDEAALLEKKGRRKVNVEEHNLYWGNYGLVDRGAAQMGKGAPPRFSRWDRDGRYGTGDGVCSVSVSHGMPFAKALAPGGTLFRVEFPDPSEPLDPAEPAPPPLIRLPEDVARTPLPPKLRYEWVVKDEADGYPRRCLVMEGTPARRVRDLPTPGSRRSLKEPPAYAWVRVASEGRAPVFVKVRFKMHRRPPEDALIKEVRLVRRKTGTWFRWKVQMVLARASWLRDDNARNGRVGVDVNWRRVDGGIRVAYAVGDDGREWQLVLPEREITGKEKAESLRGIRDSDFNAAREALARWMDLNEAAAPEWLKEKAKTIRLWKNPENLCSLFLAWREARFAGDDGVFLLLSNWWKQDGHIHNWEDFQRAKVVARRNDLYSAFARKLAREYAEVAFEDTDWRKMHAKAAVDEPDEAAKKAAKFYVVLAAPGVLTDRLKAAATTPCPQKPADTTRECHECGKVDQLDRKNIFHACTGCGATWDQDRNAALNLLHGKHSDREGAGRAAVA